MSKLPDPVTLRREQGFNDVISSIDFYYTEYVVKRKEFPDDFEETLELLGSELHLLITNIPIIEAKNSNVQAKLNSLRELYQRSKYNATIETSMDYLQQSNNNNKNMVIECLEKNQDIVEKLHEKQHQLESYLSFTVDKITTNQTIMIKMIEKQNRFIHMLEQQCKYQQAILDGLQLHTKDCMEDLKVLNERYIQLQQDVKDLHYREFFV